MLGRFSAVMLSLVGFSLSPAIESFDPESQASVAVAYAAQLRDDAPAPQPIPPAPEPGVLHVIAPACAGGTCQIPTKRSSPVVMQRSKRGRLFPNLPRGSRGRCSSCR